MFLEGYFLIPWARDVDAEFPAGEAWRPLMNLAVSGTRARGGPAAKAIRKAGAELVLRLVTRVAAAMEATEPVEISAAGCLLFQQMLFWVEICPELEVDEALYKICGVRWAPIESMGLLLRNCVKALISAVARRTSARAFACAERLANHPQLKIFNEVTQLYEQLLAENGGPVVETGVDGFALKTGMDFIVDQMLRGGHGGPSNRPGHSLGPFGPKVHLDIAMRQMRDDLPAALRAMNARVEWLAKQEPKGDGRNRDTPWLFWCCDVGELYTRILREKPRLDLDDLVGLCRADARKWLGVRPSAEVLERCTEWISANGYRKELTAEMDAWRRSVYGTSGGTQELRKRIDWLLWFDTEARIEEKSCWSAAIRSDLREMPVAKRGPWILLIQNISFGAVEKPTKKWLKVAGKALEGVGREAFRERVQASLEPLRGGRELRLSVAGRDVLGALFWYSLLAEDREIDKAVRWFAQAKWKTKADRARTAKLLPIWIHTIAERCPEEAIGTIHMYRDRGGLELQGKSLKTYQGLCDHFGVKSEISPPPPAPAFDKEAFLREALKKRLVPFAIPDAEVGEDAILVKHPSGERYRIGIDDGRIVRVRDGKPVRLEIDWNAMPFRMFKQTVDGQDLMNPFGPNRFRIMLCAQILSGTLKAAAPVVADEG